MFNNNTDVPHLTTALMGPLKQLEKVFLNNQVAIESFFRKAWQETPAPPYSSIDLRNSGFKLAPIDTNLFSAGFNNLNPDFMPLCIQAAQSTISQYFPGCERILLIPENHTRNMPYFENLATLQQILIKAGYDTRLGSLIPDLQAPLEVTLPSGQMLKISPITREDNQIKIENFTPCLILLNNDLSEGIPAILQNIKQTIQPPVQLGWSHRLKSVHFNHYEKIAKTFSEIIGIDPWLINPLFKQCGDVNFLEKNADDCLVQDVALLLSDIQKKYDEYGIKEKPFVMIKADAGTYGMAVMSVQSPEQIANLNRKERNKMAMSKGKKAVSKVILQEGVYSFETLGENQAVAEPVVYLIGHHVVGGFYRVHNQKLSHENLNAPGMHFEHLAFAECCTNPNFQDEEIPNRFYSYGVIARLAVLAAAQEIRELAQ